MKIKNKISIIALIISNLIPLYGVIFLKWDLPSIMFLYWLENFVIGITTIVKINKAQGKIRSNDLRGYKINNTRLDKKVKQNGKKALIPGFIFHYGMFTFIHFIFILTIFKLPNIPLYYIFTVFVSMLISHFMSYKINFIDKGEYVNASPSELFTQPYRRMMIMHLTIVIGGFFVLRFGQPIYALILMIIFKIILDIYLHNKEHNKFQTVVQNIQQPQEVIS
ncbi:MAG: DUF6498-containing protein [bacterium]